MPFFSFSLLAPLSGNINNTERGVVSGISIGSFLRAAGFGPSTDQRPAEPSFLEMRSTQVGDNLENVSEAESSEDAFSYELLVVGDSDFPVQDESVFETLATAMKVSVWLQKGVDKNTGQPQFNRGAILREIQLREEIKECLIENHISMEALTSYIDSSTEKMLNAMDQQQPKQVILISQKQAFVLDAMSALKRD